MKETILYTVPGPKDAGTIAQLHVASWREAYARMIPPEILAGIDLADRTARWQSYLAVPGNPTWLASVDGVAAGFIRAGRLSEPLVEGADGHIYALYVLHRFYRMGIGRALLARVATQWREADGHALSLGVLTANHPARAFYEALGARLVTDDSYEWDGHLLPESIYVFENLAELACFA
ncbi:GNAT family N-acetyltransferase [Aestuariivirga sp.]|uniref:GNAT family N-acetyltransferase n=1 Tax=Aestuariivirga sp. TaxID=2650926 RepID=UPI003BACB54A